MALPYSNVLKKLVLAGLIVFFNQPNETHASGASDEENELGRLFQSVRFKPGPEGMAFKSFIEADGPVEVKFRTTEHLRGIMERNPLISTKFLCFVCDENAEEGLDLSYLGESVRRGKFIQVRASRKLKLKGRIACPYEIYLPDDSDISGLDAEVKGMCYGLPEAYEKALDLIHYLNNFDLKTLTLRTKDADILLATRRKEREENPELYPELEDICPDLFFTSPKWEVKECYHLQAIGSRVALIASDMQNLGRLLRQYPRGNNAILLLDTIRGNNGIYTEGPLRIAQNFKILSEGDIALTGPITLPNHGLDIIANGNIWCIGLQIQVAESLLIRSERNLYGAIDLIRERGVNQKPANMKDKMWQELLDYWEKNVFLPSSLKLDSK